MTKSIDDRAAAWSERRELYVLTTPTLMEASYHQGATEQKQIDDEEYRKDMRYINIKKQELIDKACETYCKVCFNKTTDCKEFCNDLKIFREAISNE